MSRFLLILLTFIFLANCKKTHTINFAGGFVGGTYHSIAESLTKLPDWKVRTLPSNGSLDNIYALGDGKADFALVQMDMYRNAQYADDKLKEKIKPIVPVLQDEVHLVTKKEIQSISQLKGKKVVIGHSESGIKATALTILLEVGISGTDIQMIEKSPANGIPALLKGEVDAVFVVSGMPVQVLSEIPESESNKIHILPLKEIFESKINKSNKIYALGEIPVGTYSWQKEKIDTLLVQTVLFANSKVDDSIAFDLVDSILKNKISLEVGHAEWKQFTKENLKKSLQKTPELFLEKIKPLIN